LPQALIGIAERYVPPAFFARVHPAKLKYLLFTAKTLSAQEAQEFGFVLEVVSDDALRSRVIELANEVRATSPAARLKYKQYFNDLYPQATSDVLETAMAPPGREGIRAFLDKRPPKE
jgi:enoyl-CoA hydratase/carnithine racemase